MLVKQAKPGVEVQELDNNELLLVHTELHSYWKELKQDRQVGDWDEENLIDVHEEVVEELEERELTHQELNDLDEADVEQKEAEFEVKEWAEEFVEVEDKEEHIQSLEADWFLEAEEAIQSIDESVSLTDHVTLSTTPFAEVDQEVQDWLDPSDEGIDSEIVAYQVGGDDPNAALIKEDDTFYAMDETDEHSTQDIVEAYQKFEEMKNPEDETNEEILQGEVIEDTSTEDFRWYVWQREDAEQWVRNQGVEQVPEPEEEGEFLSYQVRDESGYEVVENMWVGPPFPPFVFIQGFDPTPVLLTVGLEEEDSIQGEVLAYKFQVERPPELPDVNQVDVDSSVDKDFYWMVHDENSINTWLNQQEVPTGEGSQEGEFYQYKINEPEEYDDLTTVWEGARTPPSDGELAGGQWPRRVTYGVDQDGEKEIQKIEFLTEKPYSQLAEEYVKAKGLDREDLQEEIDDE